MHNNDAYCLGFSNICAFDILLAYCANTTAKFIPDSFFFVSTALICLLKQSYMQYMGLGAKKRAVLYCYSTTILLHFL